MKPTPRPGLAGAIAQVFIGSRLTPLLITGSVLLGLLAIVALPREEEPQIKVPVVDILVAMPGSSAAEVESRVSSPLERSMWELPGVEYVYSTSQPGRSLIVVRYRVGEDPERSLVKLYQKLQTHADRMPAGASAPLVKARSIDVSTTSHVVTLRGTVGSVAEHDRAVQLAKETAGVTQVVDRLGVAR